jgi:hypothetical protein
MSNREVSEQISRAKGWFEQFDAVLEPAQPCECHRESGSHETCCGHAEGRNPDCPFHGDGSRS